MSEKLDYYGKLLGLYIEARDVATQLIMVRQGRYEETAACKINELKKNRMAEIRRRKSIISNG